MIKEFLSSNILICDGAMGTYYSETIDIKPEDTGKIIRYEKKIDIEENIIKNTFKEKIKKGKFVIAVELSAPIDTDINKIMNGAKICKDNNIDLVIVPDSPMSKVRADSVIIASKIKRRIGIEVMPHMCCRDRNTNSIRSSIIGGHIEDIRNVLAIRGNPISDASRVETKGVFNLNSFKLIELISGMNNEVFTNEGMFIGGALNLNVYNKGVEYSRMMKKNEKGAEFF